MVTGISEKICLNKNTNSTVSTQSTPFVNSIYNVSIDGVIQDTQQSAYTGDCWLLTNLNALRDTSWGAELIKKSIKQTANGDIIITFKGSKGPQKEFKITQKELAEARESSFYSTGDDDVIAFELAVEKYYKKYAHLHEKQINTDGGAGTAIDGNGLALADFVELLSGERAVEIVIDGHIFNNTGIIDFNKVKKKDKEIDRILNELEKHPGKYAVMVCFKHDWDEMHKNHAYQYKGIVIEKNPQTGEEEKFVIVGNPHDSSEDEKIPYNKFKENLYQMRIAGAPNSEIDENLLNDSDFKSKIYKEAFDNDNFNWDAFRKFSKLANKDNIHLIFDDKDSIKLIISALDQLETGWGNGDDKKALISPLVELYCDYALEIGVDATFVEEVRKNCNNELDALLYTDEEVIIENLQNLFDKIDEVKNPFKKLIKKFGL